MTPRRLSARRAVHRLAWAIALPLALLFVQLAEARHEIGHLATPTQGSKQGPPADRNHCAQCLAFAHLSGAARTEAVAPRLLADLAFGWLPEPAFAVASLAALAPRSRGPPDA